jgi:hypothetical protein
MKDMDLLRALTLVGNRPTSQILVDCVRYSEGTCKFPFASTTASACGSFVGAVGLACPYMAAVFVQRRNPVYTRLPVQQGIELGPHLIFLGAGNVAKGAFRFLLQFCSWSFRLMMIEIVLSPPSAIGIAR